MAMIVSLLFIEFHSNKLSLIFHFKLEPDDVSRHGFELHPDESVITSSADGSTLLSSNSTTAAVHIIESQSQVSSPAAAKAKPRGRPPKNQNTVQGNEENNGMLRNIITRVFLFYFILFYF